MCNLSEGIFEQGIAEGEARGEAKGFARGEAKGFAKGEASGSFTQLRNNVKALMSEGMSFESLVRILSIEPDVAKRLDSALNAQK